MAILIREVPKRHVWGIVTDPRRWMNLTQFAMVPDRMGLAVRLERDGRWCFEPQGPLPTRLAQRLQAKFERKRAHIEDAWVRYLIARGWLELATVDTKTLLVVHRGQPEERRILLPRYVAQRGARQANLRLDDASLVATFTAKGTPSSRTWPLADWLWSDR